MNYERLLAPLRRRMATLIGRCILSAVRSGEGFQTLDVVIMADENMGGVEHAEPPFGLTTVSNSGNIPEQDFILIIFLHKSNH